MSDKSSIEWTEATWNPTVGCTRVSPGCQHCYAEVMAWRHVLMCKALGRPCKYDGTVELGPDGRPRWTGFVRLDPDSLEIPLHWKRPRTIFVDSMSDIGHKGLTDHEIARCFSVMARASWHTFQVLTKRPGRFAHFFKTQDPPLGFAWPLPNVWIGTSVEDQQRADERIPALLQIPAAIRFLSVEPLLGPVRLDLCSPHILDGDESNPGYLNAFTGMEHHPRTVMVAPSTDGTVDGVQWVIVGGESGHSARTCDVEWVGAIVAQCAAASVPCFVKQLGSRPNVGMDDPYYSDWFLRLPSVDKDGVPRTKDRKGGDIGEFPPSLQVRQMPEVRVA
jgi:protein gp37